MSLRNTAWRRLRWAGLALPALLLAAGFAYNLAAARALERDFGRLPRDPATGVVAGAEAATLPGDGPGAALLVHGFLGSPLDFGDLGRELQAAGLTVRLMRLPGHGTSALDLASRTGAELLAAVRSEQAALRARHRRVALVGFSMGGSLAVLAAATEPPDALVLVAPYFGITRRWYYLLPVEAWGALLAPVVPFVVRGPGTVQVNRREAVERIYSYRALPTRAMGELVALGREARRPETLGRIKCPVLVLHAEGDSAASPARCREAFAALGGGDRRLLWYSASDHILLWDHDRAAATAEIRRFLRERLGGP